MPFHNILFVVLVVSAGWRVILEVNGMPSTVSRLGPSVQLGLKTATRPIGKSQSMPFSYAFAFADAAILDLLDSRSFWYWPGFFISSIRNVTHFSVNT